MHKVNSPQVCGHIKWDQSILPHCGGLQSEICWKRACRTFERNIRKTLWALHRLDGSKICWAHNWVGLKKREVHVLMPEYVHKALACFQDPTPWNHSINHTPMFHQNMDKNSNLWNHRTPHQSLTRKQQSLYKKSLAHSYFMYEPSTAPCSQLSSITGKQAKPTEKMLMKTNNFWNMPPQTT